MQARVDYDMATEVSFHGIIKDHHDALLLITAARFGLIPRFRRRLNLTEQDALVHSGSVFLWTEEESCMKRWTDGYPWSPSRIHDEFLVYREMVERGCARSRTTARLLANDNNEGRIRPSDDRHRKAIRLLAGSLFNSNELENLARLSTSGAPQRDDIFRRGGLMKKTFSLSLPGETWHVVSYYTLEDALTSILRSPKESQSLVGLKIADDVQISHAISLRRQALGISYKDFTESLPSSPYASSQPPHACDSPIHTFTNAEGWFDALSTSVRHPPPYQPPSSPHSCTSSRSGDYRQCFIKEDTPTEGWYNLP